MEDHIGFLLLHPEFKCVSGKQLLTWAKDASAEGKVGAFDEDDVYDAIRVLEDAGIIKVDRDW